MIYLIILMAMAMVIGPIFWARPTKKERRLAEFRALAIRRGVKIEPISLASDAYYSRVAERNLHIEGNQWVRYRRIAKDGEVGPTCRGRWVQRKDRDQKTYWEPDPVTLAEPEAVANLLDIWRNQQDMRYLSLECDARSVAIVWNEAGVDDDVHKIINALEDIGH